jgi:hypothetical protein
MVFAVGFLLPIQLRKTVTVPTRHYPSTICNRDYLVAIKQFVPRDTTYHQVCARTAKTHAILSFAPGLICLLIHRGRSRMLRRVTLTNYTAVPLAVRVAYTTKNFR